MLGSSTHRVATGRNGITYGVIWELNGRPGMHTTHQANPVRSDIVN